MLQTSRTPWVAYVGPFPYPEGAAASRRVLGVSESLAAAGIQVVVASGAGDKAADDAVVRQCDGIAYCHLAERVAEHWPRPVRRFRYAWMGAATVAWLAAQPVPPVAVILYSGYTPYLLRLLPWCRENGVRLLFDAVEWYEPEHAWGYLTSPYQWNIEWAMRRLVPQTDGVIAISRYLADYYANLGMSVVRIPPTTSSCATGAWQPDDTLRLCYAGTPGHKDDLQSVLRAVERVAADGAAIQLTIAGPDKDDVLQRLGKTAGAMPAWLQVLGRIGHAEVQALVGRSDFSVLARQRCRLSEAGFPTKFVESFASGTPVIANLTSDLHQHLREGETGFVFASPEPDAIASALRRALAMEGGERRRMRGATLAHARIAFHPGAYANDIRALVLSHCRI